MKRMKPASPKGSGPASQEGPLLPTVCPEGSTRWGRTSSALVPCGAGCGQWGGGRPESAGVSGPLFSSSPEKQSSSSARRTKEASPTCLQRCPPSHRQTPEDGKCHGPSEVDFHRSPKCWSLWGRPPQTGLLLSQGYSPGACRSRCMCVIFFAGRPQHVSCSAYFCQPFRDPAGNQPH